MQSCPAVHRAQPGADRRSRHQYRRGRDFLDRGGGRAASWRTAARPGMSDAQVIYVVEDDRDVARLLAAQLQGDGFRVVINATGGDAVEEIAQVDPRLVILDLMLPLANGLEILATIRRHPRLRELPVIVLTALGAEADRIRGLDLGADDYVE